MLLNDPPSTRGQSEETLDKCVLLDVEQLLQRPHLSRSECDSQRRYQTLKKVSDIEDNSIFVNILNPDNPKNPVQKSSAVQTDGMQCFLTNFIT